MRKSDIVDLISKNNVQLISEMRALIGSRNETGNTGSGRVNSEQSQNMAAATVVMFNTNFKWSLRGELGGDGFRKTLCFLAMQLNNSGICGTMDGVLRLSCH